MDPIAENPIAQPVRPSKLSVGLEDIAQIPDSGSGNNPSARLNLLADPGDGSGRLFVNDTRGQLHLIADGTVSEYMDLAVLVGSDFRSATGQQGFTYFAFHPEFATNGIFYTVHSENKGTAVPDFPVTEPIIDRNGNVIASSHHSVVREWTASDPSANSFSGTFREILRVEQPYRDHNMGQLAFNPNAEPGDADYGQLYLAVADGGSDGFPVSNTDPLDNGQDLSTPLGAILRIDPLGNNSTNGQYGIPADNPFVGDGDPNTLGEIWAYGLRNPHRISWDTGGDGKMLIADIGQAFIEEVNLGIAGANYGWGEREGTFVVDENNEGVVFELPENDADFGFTYPVAQYDRDRPVDAPNAFGFAIAGGFVYRGTAIPKLVGHYIFADFANDGRFFHVPVEDLVNGSQAEIQELRLYQGNEEQSFLEVVGNSEVGGPNRSDVRFGVDETGEIYVTSKQDGKVRRLVASPETSGEDVLVGTDNDNFIRGLGGADLILGNAGNDTLWGNDGNDFLNGGPDRDLLIGGKENDTLSGGSEDDDLRGNGGEDRLLGGIGNDTLKGQRGDDRLIGGGGSDRLSGNRGNDVLLGADPNDLAPGIGEIDTLVGGLDFDTYLLGDTASAYYDDGLVATPGINDYALILQLQPGDIIELHGGRSDYTLGNAPVGLPAGTGIFLADGELIGIVRSNIALDLDGSVFQFV
ncbi:PQQ-dependent sugar dehydrogenase [Oscillatoriales cyanobacterium LEGE 11467]|uniref:PQQ-dependent sugar dehydrogenase n=1 Tax=Zarconia navalis LEGE 11467 TaxID=1828826 RepID=A0A928VVP7_9CYAN|nr:PQQ-dependent sugar dehydrogenase [Zarconia navalis]MBE9041031.1 PQQ-dependent sugar dehydrogenase [Zarconia navalis LEGE 11467]